LQSHYLANATAIVDFPYTATGSIDEADAELIPFCDGYGDLFSATVYYSLTGDGATVTANSYGSNFDTILAVFEVDTSDDTLLCVTVNDDSVDLTSEVTWSTVSGTSYVIFLYVYGGGTGGDYVISVDIDPPILLLAVRTLRTFTIHQ
jgi:hypothetical protein